MLGWIARLIMKLCGWTALDKVTDVSKAVVIAAPHTSNWDALWAIVYVVATQKKLTFFAKHTLFWFPLGTVLRAFGCIPLDRSRATTVVRQAINMFGTNDSFMIALAPEGTRSRASGWKSGFYRIALGAEVPVLVGTIDYQRKEVGIVGRVDLTGDTEHDLQALAQYYEGVQGRWPEKTSPVKLHPRKKR